MGGAAWWPVADDRFDRADGLALPTENSAIPTVAFLFHTFTLNNAQTQKALQYHSSSANLPTTVRLHAWTGVRDSAVSRVIQSRRKKSHASGYDHYQVCYSVHARAWLTSRPGPSYAAAMTIPSRRPRCSSQISRNAYIKWSSNMLCLPLL